MRRHLAVTSLVVLLGSCGSSATNTIDTSVATVAMSLGAVTITPNTTVQLTATPKDASGATVSGVSAVWSTSNSSIAIVNNGLVTGVSAGVATISAVAGSKTGTTVITVQPVVGSIEMSVTAVTLVVQQTYQLVATPKDPAGNVLQGIPITWSTFNIPVASVINGLVTATGALGTATITAAGGGHSATAIVTVKVGGVVGAAGATLTSQDLLASVTVPAGALSQPIAIIIEPATGVTVSGLMVGQAYDLQPRGEFFSQPITIKLRYTTAQIPVGHDPSLLQLWALTGSTWTQVPGVTVDLANRTVTAAVSQFATFALQVP